MGRSPQRAEGLRGAAPKAQGVQGAQSSGMQKSLKGCKPSGTSKLSIWELWYNLAKKAFTTPRIEKPDCHWSLQLPTCRCIPGAAPST